MRYPVPQAQLMHIQATSSHNLSRAGSPGKWNRGLEVRRTDVLMYWPQAYRATSEFGPATALLVPDGPTRKMGEISGLTGQDQTGRVEKAGSAGVPPFIARHRCCIFLTSWRQDPPQAKITTHCIEILTLLGHSGPEPTMSPRSACARKLSTNENPHDRW